MNNITGAMPKTFSMLEVKANDLLAGLLIVLVAILVYANSLGNGFVWDDTNVIVTNPALRNRQDTGELKLAEQEFEKSLALNPLIPGVHTKMGYIRLARGDSEGAVHSYTHALGIHPSDKEARLNRGIALENLGRQKEALNDFKLFLATPGHELADARPYAEGRIRELSK